MEPMIFVSTVAVKIFMKEIAIIETDRIWMVNLLLICPTQAKIFYAQEPQEIAVKQNLLNLALLRDKIQILENLHPLLIKMS